MTTSADVRYLFVAALTGSTDAGANVFSPFTWHTAGDAYPVILLATPKERKESQGKNSPLYLVTTTVDIFAKTKAVQSQNDGGSGVALAALERLKAQIETAIINNPAVMVDSTDPNGGQRFQEIVSVDSEISINSAGEEPIAELKMTMEITFIQTAVDFFPIPSTPIDLLVQVSEPANVIKPGFILNSN